MQMRMTLLLVTLSAVAGELRAGEPDIGYTRAVQRPGGKLVTIYYWLDKPRAERYIAATIWSPPKVD